MAVTVRALIKRSFRKLHVLASGREPNAAQAAEALETLQSLYREFVGQGVFGRMNDVIVTSSAYSARENERVVCDIVAGCTVTLPETITAALLGSSPYYTDMPGDYGHGVAEYDALPRPPRDGSAIVIADINSDFEQYYIYEANRARWILLDDLTLDSVAPLTGRYENGLAAILAVRLSSEFGKEPSAVVVAEANTGRYALSMKADRSRRTVAVDHY